MKLVLFGAGAFARGVLSRLPKRYHAVALVDNDPSKQETSFHSLPVRAPAVLAELDFDSILIACDLRHHDSITRQLHDLGLGHRIMSPPPEMRLGELEAQFSEANTVIGRGLADDVAHLRTVNGSVVYDILNTNRLAAILNRYGMRGPLRCVHAGMSRSLGHEVYSAMRWGWSWQSVEPFPIFTTHFPFAETFSTIRELASIFHADERPGLAFAEYGTIVPNRCWSIDDARITYRPGASLQDLALTGEPHDVIYSLAVMEHVRDVSSFNHGAYSLLRPGGIGVHVIDFRDHRNFDDPLAFLSLDDDSWRAITDDERSGYVNRLRCSEQRKLFIDEGFRILEETVLSRNTASSVEAARRTLAAPFRDLSVEDVEFASVEFVVQKPLVDERQGVGSIG